MEVRFLDTTFRDGSQSLLALGQKHRQVRYVAVHRGADSFRLQGRAAA